MSNQPISGTPLLENVACPFCSLLCDDLVLSNAQDQLKVRKNGCPKSIQGFERPKPTAYSRIGSKRASRSSAVDRAASLLRRAHRPLISVNGIDIEGMREAVHLAEKTKAIIDGYDTAGFDAGTRVLQSRGWYTTTLGELRNRADLIVLVGVDVTSHYPNFMRRVVEPRYSLQPARRKNRHLIYIGDQGAQPNTKKSIDIETLACNPAQILEVLAALRGAVGGRSLQSTRIGNLSLRKVAEIADAIKQAEYAAFVWAPSQLGDDSDTIIHTVTRLIDDLNQTQRAAGIALGGDNGGLSAANVCTWLTGYPLHVSFAQKTLDYDPIRYRTSKLIADDSIDALLWIDAFGSQPPPKTAPGIKRIILSAVDDGSSGDPADVFIPIGTPGVDHRGRLIRTDSVVSIELDQLRRGAPSVRTVVHDILSELASG